MFHLLVSIASPSQSDFNHGKASIAKALVLVLHCFSSKGFTLSIFGDDFNSSYRFFLPILLLVRAHCFLIERVVVLGIAVVLVIALTGLIIYKRLRLFMSICIDYCTNLSTLLRRTMWMMMHA